MPQIAMPVKTPRGVPLTLPESHWGEGGGVSDSPLPYFRSGQALIHPRRRFVGMTGPRLHELDEPVDVRQHCSIQATPASPIKNHLFLDNRADIENLCAVRVTSHLNGCWWWEGGGALFWRALKNDWPRKRWKMTPHPIGPPRAGKPEIDGPPHPSPFVWVISAPQAPDVVTGPTPCEPLGGGRPSSVARPCPGGRVPVAPRCLVDTLKCVSNPQYCTARIQLFARRSPQDSPIREHRLN